VNLTNETPKAANDGTWTGAILRGVLFGVLYVIAWFPSVWLIDACLAFHPSPKDYRITLYDGGQVICAWKTADYFNAKGGGIVFNTDKGSVCIRGTYIIEQVPARTEVR
jgi:hypothetical protein